MVVLTEATAMTRIISEHVTDLPSEKAGPHTITVRDETRGPAAPAPPPGDGNGRQPPEPLHPGMRLALWVWVIGFGMLALQVVTETCYGLIRGIGR